ncbi:MAG: hypothetical protein QGH02_08175, partial [Verrucomicrobiota bacterium]|nr:hypothetical protein [Verrucomicrobiota bacterium]
MLEGCVRCVLAALTVDEAAEHAAVAFRNLCVRAQRALGRMDTVAALLAGADSAAPSLRGTQAVLALAQRLVRLATPPRVLLLTCGTLAVDASHAASDAAHGGAWGFARVLRLEHPPLRALSADAARGAEAAAAREGQALLEQLDSLRATV